MKRRKTISIFACIILFWASSVNAEGLFPKTDELFGAAMPSIRFAIMRVADTVNESENGYSEVYNNFTYEDYLLFGKYLGAYGAVLKDYAFNNSSFNAAISANGETFSFSYDWKLNVGIVKYPRNTRVEKESNADTNGECIFPPAAGIMPSAQFAISREPDREEQKSEGIIQYFSNFEDDSYIAFGNYLGAVGAVLQDFQVKNGVLFASVDMNGLTFNIEYNWKAKELFVSYPNGTVPEREKWNLLLEEKMILPELNKVGNELPRLSRAIERDATKTENLPDGGIQETYSDFSDDNYNEFGKYLSNSDCKVDNYQSDNGTVVIELSNTTGTFTFSYDALHHVAKVIYPANSRIEKKWTPTPTPQPTATPEPVVEVRAKHYSEDQCWYIAKEYFDNLGWKNPQSVTVYGHTSRFDEDDCEFVFTIDYSAMNGFGGYNRETYWITVDAFYGMVTMAFRN